MAEGNNQGVVNPVLNFLRTPAPAGITGRGKSNIKQDRLSFQREKLSSSIENLEKAKIKTYAGKSHFVVKMFKDSNAPTYTPTDLFNERVGCKIISPSYSGYLVEFDEDSLSSISETIKTSTKSEAKVDISRVDEIALFDSSEVLRGRDVSTFWDDKDTDSTFFNIWLTPFNDVDARTVVSEELKNLYKKGLVLFGDSKFDIEGSERSGPNELHKVISRYIESGKESLSVIIRNKDDFSRIITSGAVYRIERTAPLKTNKMSPGTGLEPIPSKIMNNDLPTVVVVDGGHSANSYNGLVAATIDCLISDYDADKRHGNQIISVVVQGHAWNNNLKLPELDCKFISVQAIAKEGVKPQPSPTQFVDYLDHTAQKIKKLSSVWNLSFNEESSMYNPNDVSYLGDKISSIARKYSILPIISIGNKSAGSKDDRLSPPADCEAALTISGRQAENGLPYDACNISLRGPGPAGMLKPDMSWFSELRVLGGNTEVGTSYSAPLVASLAAHAFQHLKDPTPDLVKALLINRTEVDNHDNALGYGTPWDHTHLPWVCSPDTITLAWHSKLKVGFRHYWRDIPLPKEMLGKGNKLSGEATLTAILNPIKSTELGNNYFSTRLEVALQATAVSGKSRSIINKKQVKRLSAEEQENFKWNPVRHVRGKLSGKIVSGSVRLYARIYARDLYQYSINSHHELEEQDVAFVLTLKKTGSGQNLYKSVLQELGNDVEPHVGVDQSVDIEL